MDDNNILTPQNSNLEMDMAVLTPRNVNMDYDNGELEIINDDMPSTPKMPSKVSELFK
jgi:hypothetical protein